MKVTGRLGGLAALLALLALGMLATLRSGSERHGSAAATTASPSPSEPGTGPSQLASAPLSASTPAPAAAETADAEGPRSSTRVAIDAAERSGVIVRGTVWNPNGLPVKRAQVVAGLEGQRTYRIESSQTDADGVFELRFAKVQADERCLSLHVSAGGWPPAHRTLERELSGTLELGRIELEAPLAVRGLLNGNVHDWTGWRVHGTSLADRIPGVRTRSCQTMVAPDGTFELTGFPSGTVLVEATHPFLFDRLREEVPAGSGLAILHYDGPTPSRSIALRCPEPDEVGQWKALARKGPLEVTGRITDERPLTFVFAELDPGTWSVHLFLDEVEVSRFGSVAPGSRLLTNPPPDSNEREASVEIPRGLIGPGDY